MKRAASILPLLLLLLSATCLAQNTAATKVDDYIRSEMKAQQIPGLSLAVIHNGEIVLARGYGLANVEHQVPVKPETIFQLGSIGKQFTATAVMILVEDGKLSLDDKLTKYFTRGPETWHCRRCALHDRLRHGQVGRGALHREVIEARES